MDFNKLLKNVHNVDEYISVTQEINGKWKNMQAQINITTILALKKIKSLEIEYLNKCYGTGAACILFERLLSLPPSKTWGVLGKELVSLLQYWLDAIRKHLINHSVHWWSFLKLILKFIKEICLKDSSLPNILVDLTAECLFDIASRDIPDAQQRHEILHCLNIFCAESSREIRFAMRNKFGTYFTKLATHLATSGYLPSQYSTLEALVRWLVPRHDPALRANSAARWFPQDLYPDAARELFLSTAWTEFFEDARNFLNVVNEANGLVTSVVCRKLTVGKILIISGAEKRQTWLDINSSGKSISILLDPKLLKTFGAFDHRACETLLITEEDTQIAQLHSISHELTISVNTYRPPRVQPADMATGDSTDISIVVSTKVHVRRLDAALRAVFGEKYNLQLNFDLEVSSSPARSQEARLTRHGSEEDTRFSHPVEVKRRKHADYTVKPKNPGELISPSTASTSSLAQLHDKLAALPRLPFSKEPVSVCAQPQLSSVTEISETNTRSFHSVSTLKLRPYGVCYKSSKPKTSLLNQTKKKAESDSEISRISSKLCRHLSPIVSNENSTSCLLVATVGSADDSVISNTVERLSKSKDFKDNNFVDLLVKESLNLERTTNEKYTDSGVNNKDKNRQENVENSEATEHTVIQDKGRNNLKETGKPRQNINCTVVSKSTTDDESNTEVINETPAFLNSKNSKISRRKNIFKTTDPEDPKEVDEKSFDVQSVEEFFSQHFAETNTGHIMISPTLAKKINESSSESSINLDENYLIANEDFNIHAEQFQLNDVDVVECLNEIVDKVCVDFEKCSKYLNKGSKVVKRKNLATVVDSKINMSKDTLNTNAPTQQTQSASKQKRVTKLVRKSKRKAVAKKRNNKMDQNPKKMSTIIEQKDEETLENISPKHHIIENVTIMQSPIIRSEDKSPVTSNDKPPLLKRKRKLYSPKDENIENEKKEMKISKTEHDDDIPLAELKTCNILRTPNRTSTCYKDIERERKKNIRLPRSKKCRGKIDESPSPRTLKMNTMFDELKATVESKENIVFVDKNTQSDIYNFTSDSEDDDFKKKKIDTSKRTSTTTIRSFDSAISTGVRDRPRTLRNYYKKSSNNDVKKSKTAKRKRPVKQTNSKSKIKVNIETGIDLTDEKMRKTGLDELNTSIILEKPKEKKTTMNELELHKPPEMEPITDDQESVDQTKKKSIKTKRIETLLLKKGKSSKNDELKLVSDKEDDRTVSPLPGLVVESMPTRKDDFNDSLSAVMLQKFKKIYQQDPDAVNESSNTQNMLHSDIERCNYSPQNVSVNITDEICFVDYTKDNIETQTNRIKSQKNKTDQHSKLNREKKKIKTEKISFTKDISDEVIEISEVPDDKSDKSIATDGITAHGYFDEAPPSPEMIRKRMQPREIEDLNESLRDYFLKLNRETCDSNGNERRESSKFKEDADVHKVTQNEFEKSSSVKSPTVSIQRLSFEDISKWIPSRRTSDTDSSAKSSPKIQETIQSLKLHKETKPKSEDAKKLDSIKIQGTYKQKSNTKKSRHVTPIIDSPEVKSPVAITAMSLEEFDNWLPMPHSLESKGDAETNTSTLHKEPKQNSVVLVYNTRQKSRNLKVVNNSDENKDKHPRKLNLRSKPCPSKSKAKVIENTTQQESDSTSTTVKDSRNKPKTNTIAKKTKVNITDSDSGANERPLKKTVISPIKSFDDFVTNIHKKYKSGDDECLKEIRDMFPKETIISKVNDKSLSTKSRKEMQSFHTTSTEVNLVPSQESTRKAMRAVESTSTKGENLQQTDLIFTKMDELFKCPMKRSSSPILSGAKKPRFEANVETVTMESGPSISSVNYWFNRMEPSTSANDTILSFRDMIQNVMEKLDTTLVENNRNTSKKMINLFVEAQNQLNQQQEERRKLYKTVAAGIITDMVAVMDEKFADLDRRSQQMDADFKENLKKQAFDLIREDCKRKRVMVSLLKEDVQAVLDHIERSKSSLR